MNAKKAKALRRLARGEMLEDPPREIVGGPKNRRTAVNSPNSVRGMYRALKRVYSVTPQR